MNLLEQLLDPDDPKEDICSKCNLTKPCECDDE